MPAVEASGVSGGGDFSFTCPTNTNLLVAFYLRGRSDTGLASLSYNSVSMTEKFHQTGGNTSQMFYLVNPDTGSAYTVNSPIASGDRSYDAIVAIAVSGAKTASPFSTTKGVDVPDSTGVTQPSTTITSSAGDLVIDGIAPWRNRTPTVMATGQTLIQNGTNYGCSYKAGETSTAMQWDIDLDQGAAWGLASIRGGAFSVPMMSTGF